MKVALIAKKVSQSHGGAERVAANLSRKLVDSGNDVHLYATAFDEIVEGVHAHPVRVNMALSPWKLLSFQKKVRKTIQKENFDLVYGLCQVFPVDIYRVGDGIHQYWMKLQYPNVIIRWFKYLTSLVHLAMRWLENRIIKDDNCKHFITNSKLLKLQLMEYFGLPENRISVVYNGIDHGVFNSGVKSYRSSMRSDFHIEENDLVLLFVSNNWERKGLATTIEAISKTGMENIKLVIVGRGNQKRYKSLAKENGIMTDNLIFIGRTNRVERYYGMADIFILPSRYEPFANVCLEAMACGVPVITTRSNGSSEVITNGHDGFILDDWMDADGLSSLLKRFQDRHIRNAMGKRASEAARRYSWERHVKETQQVFDRVIKER